jgi:imidazolonepropionase-like amidohydrolase
VGCQERPRHPAYGLHHLPRHGAHLALRGRGPAPGHRGGGSPGPAADGGNYVSSTGGAGDARQFSPYVDVPLVRNLADGPDEVAKAVRTNFKHGADFVKILATGAVLSKGIPPTAQQYSDAEIRAAVTEAERWGRQVGAHAHGAAGIKAAIRAGVRTIEHGSYLDDEAVALWPS